MSSALMLALLGLTFQLRPWSQALVCQYGIYEAVRNRSEQFISWTADKTYCSPTRDACQDTLLLIENGPLVKLVLIKDCASAPVQNASVTIHQEDPNLSFVSYTHVCREDLCNDLSSTLPLWGPVPSTVPGSVQCPFCLSSRGCLSPPMITCPVGSSHCYDGGLSLGGAFIYHKLRVQGCQSQPSCNLLNGTQEISPLSLQESCQPSEFLTCHQGILIEQDRALVTWTVDNSEICSEEQVCQETLLLITSGPKILLLGNKGCSQLMGPLSQKTILVHSSPPGVVVASYSQFCNSSGCNNASSTEVLLNTISQHEHVPQDPGNIECPVCVNNSGPCSEELQVVRCHGTSSRCYRGFLKIIGGNLDSDIEIQGCVNQSDTSLLNRPQFIGNIFVIENGIQSKATPVLSLAWVMGSMLSIALWQLGGISSPW